MEIGNQYKEIIDKNIEYLKHKIGVENQLEVIISEVGNVLGIIKNDKSAQLYTLRKLNLYIYDLGELTSNALLELIKMHKKIYQVAGVPAESYEPSDDEKKYHKEIKKLAAVMTELTLIYESCYKEYKESEDKKKGSISLTPDEKVNVKSKITNLVRNNETLKALEYLRQVYEESNRDLYNLVIMKIADYNSITKQKMIGIISDENQTIEIRKINLFLLEHVSKEF